MDSKENSRHLKKLILAEFGYSFFLIIALFLLVGASISGMGKLYLTIILLGLLVVVPLVFNIIQFFRHRKKGWHQRASNYLIVQMLLLILIAFLAG